MVEARYLWSIQAAVLTMKKIVVIVTENAEKIFNAFCNNKNFCFRLYNDMKWHF